MFNFHKPRVYRSADGCCICRAKSSSSRFTASRKYEKESMQCFNLHEPRNGEICNACVLLVKRYKRLPVGSKRHWGHVSKHKERERARVLALCQKLTGIQLTKLLFSLSLSVLLPHLHRWLMLALDLAPNRWPNKRNAKMRAKQSLEATAAMVPLYPKSLRKSSRKIARVK